MIIGLIYKMMKMEENHMKSLCNQMPQVHSSNVYEILQYECKGII